MFGYVQKLQISHLIPLETMNIVSYNKFSKPRPENIRQKTADKHSIKHTDTRNIIMLYQSFISFIY